MHQYALRDNLSAADNQQGRPAREPSTTTRPAPKRKRFTLHDNPGYVYNIERRRWTRIVKYESAFCCDCQSWFPVGEFANIKGQPYHYCKTCQRLHKAMYRYKIDRSTAVQLYSTTACECCGSQFKNQQHKHIHHTDEGVVGLVCLTCNHLLRDESDAHLQRLKSCVKYIERRVKI
jgi:hypothetical protein